MNCASGPGTRSHVGLLRHYRRLAASGSPCPSPPVPAEVMERWGAVLARPELQRYTEAATYFENAALKAKTPLQAVIIINRRGAPAFRRGGLGLLARTEHLWGAGGMLTSPPGVRRRPAPLQGAGAAVAGAPRGGGPHAAVPRARARRARRRGAAGSLRVRPAARHLSNGGLGRRPARPGVPQRQARGVQASAAVAACLGSCAWPGRVFLLPVLFCCRLQA